MRELLGEAFIEVFVDVPIEPGATTPACWRIRRSAR